MMASPADAAATAACGVPVEPAAAGLGTAGAGVLTSPNTAAAVSTGCSSGCTAALSRTAAVLMDCGAGAWTGATATALAASAATPTVRYERTDTVMVWTPQDLVQLTLTTYVSVSWMLQICRPGAAHTR